ncbi:hypothetical protein [Siphonobacter curvatus]|uniref:ZU5 domain-containing protein n=1 Tax=Siphonobacter curvatus TaxID=2094562 RepID=A0A2S7IGS3_9BACT|nr:hypothetical protein [Siphonobacter curvatus]PQA54549.1 hypothetical protein C5O19_22650 [Siphonobacter curvatus]
MKSISYLLLIGGVLTSCTSNPSTVEPEPITQGTPTEVGKPVGMPIQQTIGSAGGTLTTLDQRITVTIPAGALSKETLISVQPVENKAFGGTGLAYRISPENLELAKEAILTLTYKESELTGSAPEALGIAQQEADHSWKGRQNMTLDKTKRKASTPFKRLQTYAFYEQFFMVPERTTLVAGQGETFTVFFQKGRRDDPAEPYPLVKPVALKQEEVKNWRVDGQDIIDVAHPVLGMMSLGKVDAVAHYLPPTKITETDSLDVSVEVVLKESKAKLMLVSRVLLTTANAFQFLGAKVENADLAAITVVDNTLLIVSLSEGKSPQEKQALVNVSILPFTGTGTYEMKGEGSPVKVAANDRDGVQYDEECSANGRKMYGPITVHITEYDKAKKLVAGTVSGTVHHLNALTRNCDEASITMRFRAVSPY